MLVTNQNLNTSLSTPCANYTWKKNDDNDNDPNPQHLMYNAHESHYV